VTGGLLCAAAALAAAGLCWIWAPALREKGASFARRLATRRERPTAVQWAQALLFLAGAMKAGSTLDDALRLLSERAPPALRRRIQATRWNEALSPRARVERLLDGDDTAFARATLLMFLDSGGRIGRVLETAAATLQTKGEAEERVRALTAQARASAWVVGLSPFALVAAMHLLSADLVSPLFVTELWLATRLARVDV